MTLLAALAAAQDVAIKTPDTVGYMRAGYAAIAVILIGYAAFLWQRGRRAR